MLHDPIDHGRCSGGVDEDPAPAREGQVGRDDEALPLVDLGDEAEEEIRSDLVEGHVAELVEDQDGLAAETR